MVNNIEGIPFYERIVQPNGENVPYLTFNAPKYIVVHETENYSKGADAWMHNKFVANGGGSANVSFTFSVDDEVIVQNLDLKQVGWHAGDGYHGDGNRRSISIEMCEHKYSDRAKTEANTQALIRWLLKEFPHLNTTRIKPHKHFSSYSKNCPGNLLPRWDSFIKGIKTGKGKVGGDSVVISKNDKGSKVKMLQETLLKLGYDMQGYGADGQFGPATEKAVRQFQSDNSLKVDGLWGPNTKEAAAQKLEELKQKKINDKKADQEVINLNKTGFKDVKPDAWYADAAKRMKAKDILEGIGDGMFGVDQTMTRQEAAVMADNIVRYIENKLK